MGSGATASERCSGLARGLGRGQGARHTSMGSLQEPGRPRHLRRRTTPVRVPADQRSRLAAKGRPHAAGANEAGAQAVPSGEGNRSPAGRRVGRQRASGVPTKPGNRPDGTRWREGGLRDTEPNEGNDVEIAESREHLNATSSDSAAGEGGPRAVVHVPGPQH